MSVRLSIAFGLLFMCVPSCNITGTGPEQGTPPPFKVVDIVQIESANSWKPVYMCSLNSAEFVYIADEWGYIHIINALTNTYEGSIPLSYCRSIAVDSYDEYLYASSSSDIAVISVADNTVEAMIPLGTTAGGVCLLPYSGLLYVTEEWEDRVVVLDVTSHQIVDSIAVGADPTGICATPSGDYVYVTNKSDGTVSVIRTADNEVITEVFTGSSPTSICSSPDGMYIYISVSQGVVLYNTIDSTVATISLESWNDIYVAPLLSSLEYLYATDGKANGSVYVLSVSTQELLSAVQVGSGPRALCSLSSGESIYIANEYSKTVTVLGY